MKMGDKTIILEKMAELSKVISEKTGGKLGTKGKPWKWAKCKSDRLRLKKFEVGGKSERENLAPNLGTIPGQSKGSCSSQICKREIIAREGVWFGIGG